MRINTGVILCLHTHLATLDLTLLKSEIFFYWSKPEHVLVVFLEVLPQSPTELKYCTSSHTLRCVLKVQTQHSPIRSILKASEGCIWRPFSSSLCSLPINNAKCWVAERTHSLHRTQPVYIGGTALWQAEETVRPHTFSSPQKDRLGKGSWDLRHKPHWPPTTGLHSVHIVSRPLTASSVCVLQLDAREPNFCLWWWWSLIEGELVTDTI